MSIFNHYDRSNLTGLVATLDCFAEAGIDPSFDADMEELERQFAELRIHEAND